MNQQDHAQVKTIPPLIPLFFIVLAWLFDKYVYAWPIPLTLNIQTTMAYILMPIAGLLFAFSLYFFITTKQNPGPHTSTNTLYTGGVFKITRNPIYLGFIVAQLVVAIKLNNLFVVLSVPFVWFLLNNWVIKPEEDYLEKLFGQEYLSYKQKVRRWL